VVASERASGQHHIGLLMDLLKDESLVEALSQVHKTMLPYYAFYANIKGLLNFEGFSK